MILFLPQDQVGIRVNCAVHFLRYMRLGLPAGERKEIVPGASHFAALAIAQPSWRNAYQVATIGDHTFLKVQSLKPQQAKPGRG